MLEYGTLAQRYAREFDHKWLRAGALADEPLIGSADIQSLADLGNSFEVVKGMRWAPFTLQTLLHLAVATLLPVAPLLLTTFSLEQLAERLMLAPIAVVLARVRAIQPARCLLLQLALFRIQSANIVRWVRSLRNHRVSDGIGVRGQLLQCDFSHVAGIRQRARNRAAGQQPPEGLRGKIVSHIHVRHSPPISRIALRSPGHPRHRSRVA